jgi:chromatin remodeling complex protein RSC6
MATKQKNTKFMQPMKVSEDLAEVVGKGPMPRTEVTKKLWAYIKSKKLQDPKNKRNILPDDKLSKVFGGNKKAINMFEMTKLVNKHLS